MERDFVIEQHSRTILDLLAQQQWLQALRELNKVRRLLPPNRMLQHLYSFNVYLLAKQQNDWQLQAFHNVSRD